MALRIGPLEIIIALVAFLLVVLLLRYFINMFSKPSISKKTGLSIFYSSGILNSGEEIHKRFEGSQNDNNKWKDGLVLFTNKRFIFCRKPPGWRAKGFDVVFDSSWGDVVSVTASGMLTKTLHLTVKRYGQIDKFDFNCKNHENRIKQIIENKNAYKEKETIQAKTVIIEEANRDKAAEILQKRLARGEITLDEFHQKIQRT